MLAGDAIFGTPCYWLINTREFLTRVEQQDVSLLAAAYNMAGFILMSHDEKDKAKFLFQQALQIAPDFRLAAGNYKTVSTP